MAVADIGLDDGQKALGFYIRVNSWFVDLFEGVIRENSTWTASNGSVRVEVWSDLQMKDFNSFVGAKMYFGGWTPTSTQPVVATPSVIETKEKSTMQTEIMSLEEARGLPELTTRIVKNLEKIHADPTDLDDTLEKTTGIVANLKAIEEAEIEANK